MHVEWRISTFNKEGECSSDMIWKSLTKSLSMIDSRDFDHALMNHIRIKVHIRARISKLLWMTSKATLNLIAHIQVWERNTTGEISIERNSKSYNNQPSQICASLPWSWKWNLPIKREGRDGYIYLFYHNLLIIFIYLICAFYNLF